MITALTCYQHCQAIIAEVDRGLPKWAGLEDRARALRRAAWRAHRGTSWGKKKWAEACRNYLRLYEVPTPRPSCDDVRQLLLFGGAQ